MGACDHLRQVVEAQSQRGCAQLRKHVRDVAPDVLLVQQNMLSLRFSMRVVLCAYLLAAKMFCLHEVDVALQAQLVLSWSTVA